MNIIIEESTDVYCMSVMSCVVCHCAGYSKVFFFYDKKSITMTIKAPLGVFV